MKRMSALLFLVLTQCISSTEKKASKDTDFSNSVSKIDTNADVTEIKIKEDTKVYNIDSIDVKPEFEKGIKKLHKFIRQNYRYPEEELQVKGIVDVNFIVEKDGYLSNIIVVKDADFGTGNEAIRILKKCPRWTHGTLNKKPVRVRYYLTIPINTNDEQTP
ncbi:energy transducer TonB [Flavobacterium sp. H4147]|uniref:energy transducer TonB n=1 Tax=Flavobacterium sp. H4147 TaxID=3034149 RepID=UPI0023EC6036|nr:energy transducer TonB [Flavobacterium sp. H4147]